MDGYLKLMGVLLAFLALTVFLRQKSAALAVGFTMGVILFTFGILLPQLSDLWNMLQRMLSASDLDPAYFIPLFKVVGISICTRISAELCRDAGERAFGAKIELAGAAAALLCALPLAQQMLELISGVTP